MGRSKATAPISNRDCVALLKSWGFVQTGGNGGHLVFEKDGRQVQVTAPGRRTPTPYKALRKAAEIAGVRLDAFMRGPVKEKRVEVKTVDTAVVLSESTLDVVRPRDPRIGFQIETLVPPVPEVKGVTCPVEGCGAVRKHEGHMQLHMRLHARGTCLYCKGEYNLSGLPPHMRKCPAKATYEAEPDDGPLVAPLPKKDTVRAPIIPDSPVDEPVKRGIEVETENEEVKSLLELVVPVGQKFTPTGLRVLAAWVQASEDLYKELR